MQISQQEERDEAEEDEEAEEEAEATVDFTWSPQFWFGYPNTNKFRLVRWPGFRTIRFGFLFRVRTKSEIWFRLSD